MLDGEKGRSARRAWDIVAYVGPNGSGKSLHAVHDTLPTLEAGRPVLSTIRLLDYTNPRDCEDDDCPYDDHPEHGQAHPLWLPFRTWDDLLEARSCDVLMDEVAGVASARQSMGLPAPVETFLQKLRKRDLRLRWTAPAWARADLVIRECTQAAVVCSGHFARRAAGREWSTATVFKTRLLDARVLDDLTSGVITSTRALNVSWTRLSALDGRDAYRTLGDVMSLPVVEGGRCVSCGGRRSVPACSCGDDRGAAGRSARGPRRGARTGPRLVAVAQDSGTAIDYSAQQT